MAKAMQLLTVGLMLIISGVVPASALYWGTSVMVGQESWTMMRRYRSFRFVQVSGGPSAPNQLSSLRSLCAEQGMQLADPRSQSDLDGMMGTLPDGTTPFYFDAAGSYNSFDLSVTWWARGATALLAQYSGYTGVAKCSRFCSNLNSWANGGPSPNNFLVLAITGNSGVGLRALSMYNPQMPNFVCEMTACPGCWNEPWSVGRTAVADFRRYWAYLGPSSASTSYDHAGEWCTGKGLNVATIRTQVQLNAVMALNIQSLGFYLAPTAVGHLGTWTGPIFSDVATSTSCSGTFCNFASGQPDNWGGIESYMFMMGAWGGYGFLPGQWNDAPYSWAINAILCEENMDMVPK